MTGSDFFSLKAKLAGYQGRMQILGQTKV